MWTFLSTSALLSGTLACATMVADEAMPRVGAESAGVGTIGEPGELRIADFEGSSSRVDPHSGAWQTVNDTVMGGRSTGGGTIRDGVLAFAGTLNTNGGGFTSVRATDQQWDLAAYDGIAARVRGDGRTYMIQFRTSQRVQGRTVSYRASFATDASGGWSDVFLPFDDLEPSWRGRDLSGVAEPINLSDIRSIGVMLADGRDGTYELEVDWLKAVTRDSVESDTCEHDLADDWDETI